MTWKPAPANPLVPKPPRKVTPAMRRASAANAKAYIATLTPEELHERMLHAHDVRWKQRKRAIQALDSRIGWDSDLHLWLYGQPEILKAHPTSKRGIIRAVLTNLRDRILQDWDERNPGMKKVVPENARGPKPKGAKS